MSFLFVGLVGYFFYCLFMHRNGVVVVRGREGKGEKGGGRGRERKGKSVSK